MIERAQQLHTTAVGQIEQLIGLLSSIDEATLRLPCPGREKPGDGTVGALVHHTADNYQRIAAFVQGGDRMSATHKPSADTIDPSAVIAQLSAARDALARLLNWPPSEPVQMASGARPGSDLRAAINVRVYGGAP
jgi:hypothetical protein